MFIKIAQYKLIQFQFNYEKFTAPGGKSKYYIGFDMWMFEGLYN